MFLIFLMKRNACWYKMGHIFESITGVKITKSASKEDIERVVESFFGIKLKVSSPFSKFIIPKTIFKIKNVRNLDSEIDRILL